MFLKFLTFCFNDNYSDNLFTEVFLKIRDNFNKKTVFNSQECLRLLIGGFKKKRWKLSSISGAVEKFCSLMAIYSPTE